MPSSPRERVLASGTEQRLSEFLRAVGALAGARMEAVLGLTARSESAALLSGKMLRSRLAGRLALAVAPAGRAEEIQRAAAAVELVHTASLCHDDVIDNALLRRAQPTLWRMIGASGAVLIGDLLLCEAVGLLLEARRLPLIRAFMDRVREVCFTEARQELQLRGQALDVDTCLALARGKTGALFAFAAEVCGGDDTPLGEALAEAGYCIGTAYQLGDDLLDVSGSEQAAGKTLGTDQQRSKFTLPQASADGRRLVRHHVDRLCRQAQAALAAWPEARMAVAEFLTEDLQPVLERFGDEEDLRQPVAGQDRSL